MKTPTRSAPLVFAATLAACDPPEERVCEPAPGLACVLMGTGIAALGDDGLPPRETELYLPQDVTVASDGTAYVLDWNNHRIRSVRDEVAVTLVGTGYLGDAPAGNAGEVSLNHPTHISLAPDGSVIIAAWHNSKLLRYDPKTEWVEPFCGTGARAFSGDGGPASEAVLDLPVATAIAPDGVIYIADQANQRIRRIGLDGIIETFAGNGVPGFSGDGGPARDAQIALPGGQAAPPAGRITVDAVGNLYIADTSNHRIRKIDTDGIITTIAGDGTPAYRGDEGPATRASLSRPSDVEVDRHGNVFIADTDNSCIRKVDTSGVITTVVGTCGSPGRGTEGVPGTELALDRPYGLDVSDDGAIVIADTHNHRIVIVHPS